ncbi:hypothetical protein DEAC_c40940 [Desulfosporosinus acididurans]|uniref:DUF3231 family protein n=1 Tax=Desulfosporosinus acididurans TaxID=476652 RepID=A0A0J1FKF5_9FIRM|nr:DUF3231 family protein [Desulfosporosinus acididurans]KLU63964.1 hypothetical protein DEAC_c40940 [Desulfosporosinus acididurans]
MTIQEFNQASTQQEQVSFGAFQHNVSNILPTSPEIGYLWSGYLAECMSVCFLKDYVSKAKDPDIRMVLQQALDVSTQRVTSMEGLLNSINCPIPDAFGEKDVDVNAKELFSESFTLQYTRLMQKFVLYYYCNAMAASTRSDFRKFFVECINTSTKVHQKSTDVLLAKGIIDKPPIIQVPSRVDYVHDKDYFGSLIGKKRPLNALEISHLYALVETKELIETLHVGYSQVVKSEKIKKYLLKAIGTARDHLKILSAFLSEESLPTPKMTKILISDTKESSVSDRLILTHSTSVIGYILTEYGIADTNSARSDLVSTFRGLVTDVLFLAKNGAELMVEYGWLEKVPDATDRDSLH